MSPVPNNGVFARETRTEYSRPNTFLRPNHLQLLRDLAISPEMSRARGYQTITSRSALRRYGFSSDQCRPPALLIPIFDSSGRLVSYQIRPDEPRIDRDFGAMEYDICPGRQSAIDVPPACIALLADPGAPLYITDEVFKADSAASWGLCCVDLVGFMPKLDDYDLEGRLGFSERDGFVMDDRLVRFIYDADATRRPDTTSAFAALQRFLQTRKARIEYINL
jgi:hypothetical protein